MIIDADVNFIVVIVLGKGFIIVTIFHACNDIREPVTSFRYLRKTGKFKQGYKTFIAILNGNKFV